MRVLLELVWFLDWFKKFGSLFRKAYAALLGFQRQVRAIELIFLISLNCFFITNIIYAQTKQWIWLLLVLSDLLLWFQP